MITIQEDHIVDVARGRVSRLHSAVLSARGGCDGADARAAIFHGLQQRRSDVCGASARCCAPKGEPPVPIPSARPALFYGWVIVATTFLIALVTVGGRSAFGVFVVPMSEEFGWSRSTISLAAALGFLVNGLGQPFVGRLFDTLGGRKVILASLAMFGITTVLLAMTFHIVFLIVVFGVLMSIAWSGTSLTTTSALLSRWFQRRRATVLSLSTAGASAGGLLLVPLAMYVLQQTDWRMTWVTLGVLVLVVAWPLACVLPQGRSRQTWACCPTASSRLPIAARSIPLVRLRDRCRQIPGERPSVHGRSGN